MRDVVPKANFDRVGSSSEYSKQSKSCKAIEYNGGKRILTEQHIVLLMMNEIREIGFDTALLSKTWKVVTQTAVIDVVENEIIKSPVWRVHNNDSFIRQMNLFEYRVDF